MKLRPLLDILFNRKPIDSIDFSVPNMEYNGEPMGLWDAIVLLGVDDNGKAYLEVQGYLLSNGQGGKFTANIDPVDGKVFSVTYTPNEQSSLHDESDLHMMTEHLVWYMRIQSVQAEGETTGFLY